ncbi:hypothetical protein [Sporosarcina gallistercoris]|uniref:Uncharacterized protein n=1 Tax=Sporosarcina gallistercoris TaxID=2762245 RepID=A0ABR8PIN0_9BACL|nr:hypothetical protein [Sporosarcina gallistercoris]MBD7908030.1 hypothetical protein [Sporosarcina gallistercoris]
MNVKKSYLVAVLLAAIIFISVLVIDNSDDTDPDSGSTIEHVALSGPGEISDYTDPPDLTEHQVALNDLYVKIPNQKRDVELTKRTTDNYIIVDISDKETGELLYTYGESSGHEKEKLVFREIPTKEGMVLLQMVVILDPMDRLISTVVDTTVVYDPKPDEVETEAIDYGSRSGEFPAENVEVLANLNMKWGNERQNLYEGYEVGVIGE